MEWIIAIIVLAVIAWIAIGVARRGNKGGESPPAGEPHRADPGERDDPGPIGDPDPDDPDEGPGPPRDRYPGDGPV